VRSPRFGEPVRVAFVGQKSAHGAQALHSAAGGLQPRFFDFRPAAGDDAGELAKALDAWAPDVVVTFTPAGATVAVLGPGGFERTIAANPSSPAWRTMPLPVDDRLYGPAGRPTRTPRALFVGDSTAHRERFLIGAKHSYDLLHYAHGLQGDELAGALGRTDIGVNVRDRLREGFEHTALVHLAAGHLLISEPLTPTFGLEPGTDYVEITRPDELMSTLYLLERRPDSYDRVRFRGRDKAEAHRASAVWPRLVADALSAR
jgi:hypothetical protein